MSKIKAVLLTSLTLLLLIQLFRPVRNQNGQVQHTDITRYYPMQEKVKAIVNTSCND